jgi:holo-[acyl-carrier protein] synthase
MITMIFGVGIDLLDSRRLARPYSTYGDRWVNKILSSNEKLDWNHCMEDAAETRKINFLAKRFSVKEAFVKAIGTGFGRGITWKNLSLFHNLYGQPQLQLDTVAVNILRQRWRRIKEDFIIHVSLADEGFLINTIVIIAAEKVYETKID